MIRLNTTTRKLDAVLSAAVATTQPSFVASWSDASNAAYLGGVTPGNLNGVTVVTIVAAPAASVVRDIDYISIVNRDTNAAVVTINFNDNGTDYQLFKAVLAAGDVLTYTHSDGWKVTDSTGNTKTSGSGGDGSGQMLGNNAVKSIGYYGQVISENLTVVTNTNGLSAGPITIANGYTVTLENGTTWSVV